MKHIFLTHYKDGGYSLDMMNVDKNGRPTKAEYDHLMNKSYSSFANLTAMDKCGGYFNLEDLAKLVGLE